MRHVLITGNVIPDDDRLKEMVEKLRSYADKLLILFDGSSTKLAGVFEEAFGLEELRCVCPRAFFVSGPMDFDVLENDMNNFPYSETILFCVSPNRFRELIRRYTSGFGFDEQFLRRMLMEKNRVLHIDFQIGSIGII